jgi:hypothetical protein
MSQGIASLHKILKDETRQQIILLLNEKGSLSYTDLMDTLGFVGTGLLNYHLKVLADLLMKNEAGQYTLSEKGQLAYRVMTEFSSNQPQVIDKRIYKSWIIFTIATVLIVFLNGYFLNIGLDRTLAIVAIVLLITGFAFYIRIKPSASGNRVFFVFVGATVLGSVFWVLIALFMKETGLRMQLLNSSGTFGDNFFALASLIICWVIGGFIGDLIGKSRNYVIPMLKV